MKTNQNLFTPNVIQSHSELRYKLYKRSKGYSITPRGKVFRATTVRDTCGLSKCFCGAFLTPLDDTGFALLRNAKVIDSQCNEI